MTRGKQKECDANCHIEKSMDYIGV